MDHDTKGGNAACCVFPEVTITLLWESHSEELQGKSNNSVLTITRIAFNSAHHHARPELMVPSSPGLKKLSETL